MFGEEATWVKKIDTFYKGILCWRSEAHPLSLFPSVPGDANQVDWPGTMCLTLKEGSDRR